MKLLSLDRLRLCNSAAWLLASWLLVACSTSPSPTPTTVAAAPTAIPEPTTPIPTTVPSPAATPSSPSEAATLTAEVTTKIAYAKVGERDTYLDVYAPTEPGSWPVVVVAHGASQEKIALAHLSELIASQGAVVYNIGMIMLPPHHLSTIQQIACAVRFARATAADHGGDPSRVTLVGNSAGAATGSVVALAGDDFEGDCVATDASALPDALVGFEGPYDYATTVYQSSFDHTILKDSDPELWHAINPYSHIGRNSDLQVRLVHGDAVDDYWEILPEVSMGFYEALVDAEYDAELIAVKGASHTALVDPYSDVEALVVQLVMDLAQGSSQ